MIMGRFDYPTPAMPPCVDLTKITCNSDKTLSVISFRDIEKGDGTWLVSGEVLLAKSDRDNYCTISARMPHLIDSDHSYAYAFRFEVVGLEFDMVTQGRCVYTAWIRGDVSSGYSFHVPDGVYSPKVDKSMKCKSCKGNNEPAHYYMGNDGNYLPPQNDKLFELVRGRSISISIGSSNG